MPQAKLYSIAAIAKLLDLPESTLHYWKNRFDRLLPSVGNGRHKRFRSEAVDIFKAIGNLLGSGLSVADAKAELTKSYPLNVTPEASSPLSPAKTEGPEFRPSSAEDMAMRIGAAMAEAIGQKLQPYLAHPGGQAALPDESAAALKQDLAQARSEIEELKRTKDELASKLSVLEAELIRLRKDGREMEKHLMGKIKAIQKS